MTQSRRHSLLEAVTNTVVGLLVTLGAQTPFSAIKAVQSILGSDSSRRAATIVRTEVSRAFALASKRPGARRLDQLEVELIERVMREVGGNLSAAARLLGVSRNRLYRKLGRTGSGGGDEG